MGIDSYSITAGSNTAINGIGLSDAMIPTNLDNVPRELMADIRRAFNDIGGKAVSSGTDTVTLTTETVYTAYADGTLIGAIIGGTNTGPATLNLDGVGAKKILKGAGTELAAGDQTAGMAALWMYRAAADSGTGAWMLLNPLVPDVSGFVTKALFDANTIIAATSDNTPAAVTVAEQTLVGRITSGNITALTDSQVRTLLGLVIGTNVQAYHANTARTATGTYTGNGATSLAITGVGFQPKYVRIWTRHTADGTPEVWETTDTIVDDNASGMAIGLYDDTGLVFSADDNRIIAFGADGFTVDDAGSDVHPNANAQVYNYLAIG